ncbi:conjugal transfer protein, partial [Vibrio cholerae]|nr:conjugal transfer protein [Vibrio cholerae]
AKENQGILTVSAHVNGRNVEIPVREVEPQLLAVNGVYSSFVVHAGNTKIPVTR